MATIKHALTQLRQRIEKWLDLRSMAYGHMSAGVDPARIRDGVDYSQPVILPQWVETELRKKGDGAVAEYIRESYRSATHMQFDSPYKTDLPFNPVTEDPLKEWAWQTRTRVISSCHAAAQRNPLAKRAVGFTSNFVVRDGFKLTCKNRDVEKVLEEFIENRDNRIREYERQAVSGLLCDGELILRLYREKGQVVAVPQRPWELEYIRTELGFFRRAISYLFQVEQTEGDSPIGGTKTERVEVPAEDVLFVAINNHAYELRGRPELYVVLPWLKAYNDWLENRARINYWRSVLVWLVRVATANPSVTASVAARWSKPPTPGTVAIESDKVEVEALNNPIDADNASEDGRQLKLMNLIGFGHPEYFYGDGYNANLATATAQELPALTTFQEFQRVLTEELWKPLFRIVLQEAIDAGTLPEEVEEQDEDGETQYEEIEPDEENPDSEDDAEYEAFPPSANGMKPPQPIMPPVAPPEKKQGKPKTCPTLESFEVRYEPLQKSDIGTLANALNIALQNELVDRETASTELGFDYAKVQKALRREKDQELTDMAQGRRPVPPGFVNPDALPPDEKQAKEEAA